MTLDDAKQLVSDRYLGQAGIHGVGIRRRDDALSLYVEDHTHPDLTAKVLPDIEREVQPHRVIAVPAERPRLMPS